MGLGQFGGGCGGGGGGGFGGGGGGNSIRLTLPMAGWAWMLPCSFELEVAPIAVCDPWLRVRPTQSTLPQ